MMNNICLLFVSLGACFQLITLETVFFSSGWLLIFFGLFVKAFYEFSAAKKFIKEQKIKKIQSKERREKILESLEDTQMIYDYFRETNEKLPDSLHNIMLLYCLKDDFYAERYIKLCKIQ